MKLLVFNALMLMSFSLYAQEMDWTDKEIEVLNQFDLQKNDIRGVIFTNDDFECEIVVNSENEALLAYLVPSIRRDLVRICVPEFDSNYTDQILGIHEVIKIYINKNEIK
ncbi:MAG: hypothetical protein ACPG8K_00460 [Crocinitomicaceae bacterium]